MTAQARRSGARHGIGKRLAVGAAGGRCGSALESIPELVVAARMSAGRLEETSNVLLHNTTDYPPPWNELDPLARAYEKRGDTEQAIQYYLLSLKQNLRNESAKKKLTEMGIQVPELP